MKDAFAKEENVSITSSLGMSFWNSFGEGGSWVLGE